MAAAFSHVGLDWEEHVRFDDRYLRPSEVDALCGDAGKAERVLGWKPTVDASAARADHGRRRRGGAVARGPPVDRPSVPGRLAGDAVTTFRAGPLDRDATTYVAGHRGMVGSAVWRRLEAAGFTDLRGRASSDLDLRDREAVFDHLAEMRPRYVVLAAAKVGGILANDTYPVEFLSDNLRIQTNVMDAALEQRVERLLFLGSSCIYPRLAPPADPRGLPADRPARGDQRRLRDRQDHRNPGRPGRPP